MNLIFAFVAISCTNLKENLPQKNSISMAIFQPSGFIDMDSSIIEMSYARDLHQMFSRFHEIKLLNYDTLNKFHGQDLIKSYSENNSADYIISGFAQKELKNVSLSQFLVRSWDSDTLWAKKYYLNVSNIIDVEKAVFENICSILSLNPEKGKTSFQYSYTIQTDAYREFSIGRTVFLRQKDIRNENLINLAIQQFKKAIKIDPNFAEATAWLSKTMLEKHYLSPESYYLDSALLICENAIRLDPNCAEAYFVRGLIKYHKNQWENAGKDYQKAIDLMPNHYYALRKTAGYYHYYLKDFEESIPLFIRSFDLLPKKIKNQALYEYLADMCNTNGMFDQAIVFGKLAYDRNPTKLNNILNLMHAYNCKMVYPENTYYAKKVYEQNPENMFMIACYADALLFAGELELAKQYYIEIEKLYRNGINPSIGPGWMLFLSYIYQKENLTDSASYWLQKAEDEISDFRIHQSASEYARLMATVAFLKSDRRMFFKWIEKCEFIPLCVFLPEIETYRTDHNYRTIQYKWDSVESNQINKILSALKKEGIDLYALADSISSND